MKSYLSFLTTMLFFLSTTAQSSISSLSLKNKSIYCIKIIDKSTKEQAAFVFSGWPNTSPIYKIVFASNNRYTKFKGDGSLSFSGTYSISGESIILKGDVSTVVYKIVNRKDSPFITLQSTELEKEYIHYCIISGGN